MRTYKVYGLEHLALRRRRRKKASVYGLAWGGRYEHARPNFQGGRACMGGGGGLRRHLDPVRNSENRIAEKRIRTTLLGLTYDLIGPNQ